MRSIPDGVTDIKSGHTMVLRLTQPLANSVTGTFPMRREAVAGA